MSDKKANKVTSLKDIWDLYNWDTEELADSLVSIMDRDPESKEYIRSLARKGGSSGFAAASHYPIFSLIPILTNIKGNYTGQAIENRLDSYRFKPKENNEPTLENPNLLDIYLGYQDQVMPIAKYNRLDERVAFNEDTPVYDIEPYSRFGGFWGGNQEDQISFLSMLSELEPGKTMDIPEAFTPAFGTNIDLGRFNPYIGKDEKGGTFFGIQDKWDFEGDDYNPSQKVMEALEAEPMNMYGRFYFDSEFPWYLGGR